MPLHIPTLGERVTEADIWAYTTRTLTDMLLTWAKEGESTLIADGTVQTIYDITKTAPFKGQLYLDLSNLAGIDSVIVIEYVQKSATDSLVKFTQTVFTGILVTPMVITAEKIIGYRHLITLQQTAGVFRSFKWQYLSEVLS